MANALTGGFDAVLQIDRRTIRRLLASMHARGGASSGDLPRLPHNLVFRIGDDVPVAGVRGKVQAQLGVPQIVLVTGSEIGPAAGGKVIVSYPARAWFRPDPGTAPLPPFIHGVLQAAFRVTVETQPAGSALRFTPSDDDAEFTFTSKELTAGQSGQVAQQAAHFLRSWSAASPFIASLGALDFPLRARGLGDVVTVALPLPGGQPPPSSLAGVTQDLTMLSPPADFAVAVSQDYVLGLVQPFLADVKAAQPTFTVSPSWPLPTSTYTVHVSKAVAAWASGTPSAATITLSLAGNATTPTMLPNADWSVSLGFHLAFDGQTLTLTAAGDPSVNVDVHGPAGGLVEGKAEALVKDAVKKQRDAALPGIQAQVAAALPAQIARLQGLLLPLVASIAPSLKWARFGPHGVVFGGLVGGLAAGKASPATIAVLPDGSGYSAFDNWLPGGWITTYRWLWASWAIDPVTGQPTLQPGPGPLPGTHVWPHEEKSFHDRFVLQEGNGIDLPGPGGGATADGDTPLWQLCLYVAGVQIDPITGNESAYPLSPWGPAFQSPDAPELVTSIGDPPGHPGSCFLGETGTPTVYGVPPGLHRYPWPDPALELAGLWVKCTWLDHDPQPGGGTFVGHLDVLARADLALPMRGRATVFQFLSESSPEPALRLLGEAFRAARVASRAVALQLVLPEGFEARLSAESARTIRALGRELPGVRLLALEDVQGGWSGALGVPSERAAQGAVRVVDAAGRLVFSADGPVDARALSQALDRLGDGQAPARAQPMVPVFGPGIPPGDLLMELTPGQAINRRHLRGQPLVLGFARAWSAPCRAALRELAVAHPRLAEGGVTVLGVLTGADPRQAATFRAQQELPFPILADPEAAIARSCALRLWPTVLWLEKDWVRARAGVSSAALAAYARLDVAHR